MTIPPSFLVKDNAKTFFFFFAKMMKMMKAILAAVWHLLDKYSFATPDLYFLLPKFSSLLMRVGGVARASHGKTTTLMNMSANVGEFLPKTTSRNPYKKPDQTTVGNDNMQSGIHAIIIWKYFYYSRYSLEKFRSTIYEFWHVLQKTLDVCIPFHNSHIWMFLLFREFAYGTLK